MRITKLPLTLESAVHDALEVEAKRLGRETSEHIRRILAERVIATGTLGVDDAGRLRRTWHVVDQCVDTARRICRDGGFSEHITLEAIQQCTRNPSWLEDYAKCIDDDVYKHGNPLKGPINRAIGAQIRAGIGGVVKRDPSGKPVMRRVLGEIVQTYTLFDTFDPEEVHEPGGSVQHTNAKGRGQSSGDSCPQRGTAP